MGYRMNKYWTILWPLLILVPMCLALFHAPVQNLMQAANLSNLTNQSVSTMLSTTTTLNTTSPTTTIQQLTALSILLSTQTPAIDTGQGVAFTNATTGGAP